MTKVYKSKTIWVYTISLFTTILGWEYITDFVSEQTVAVLLSGAGIVLRFLTNKPLGFGKE